MTLDSHLYRDPMLVLQDKQEREARGRPPSRQRRKLNRLFGEEDEMGRKLEIPGHVAAAMHQWGDWAARPNFWADLRITPFCKLMGMSFGKGEPTIRLDPQSQAIHRAVMGLACEKTKAVLFAYYVMNYAWADKPEVFARLAITKDKFYRALRTGSIMVVNAAGVPKGMDQTISGVISSISDSVCEVRT